MVKGFRDMKKDLAEREHNNPLNMSDHDIQEESYNIAVERNSNLSAFTKEQEARQRELFEESSNRIYEKTYGHRPIMSRRLLTPPLPTKQESTETQTQAETIYKFTHLINNRKSRRT